MTRQSLIIIQKKASRKENSLDVKSHWLCHQSKANKNNTSIMLKRLNRNLVELQVAPERLTLKLSARQAMMHQ
jgi:hypothetical protein